ncbi:hypothetical protein G210_4856 [Candida maltosa Xu316]|uniref:Spc7 kinetochore protein domain-containing protein n=1 Tax=Candida maltosa (strain Xu316) TaxID=1245528 RepID=M3JDA0_CANMX|nr:hypothetical protein G210_4856 [Candida maltosa Xu316]
MTKSILKDNTLPIQSESEINSQSNSQQNGNRRVSFAREVTLRKIDYIQNPNNKRRRTIDNVELEGNDLGYGGDRMLSDSSDEDEEDQDENNDSFHEPNDDDEEETMDLAGDQRKKNQPVSSVGQLDDDVEDMEFTEPIERIQRNNESVTAEHQSASQPMDLTQTPTNITKPNNQVEDYDNTQQMDLTLIDFRSIKYNESIIDPEKSIAMDLTMERVTYSNNQPTNDQAKSDFVIPTAISIPRPIQNLSTSKTQRLKNTLREIDDIQAKQDELFAKLRSTLPQKQPEQVSIPSGENESLDVLSPIERDDFELGQTNDEDQEDDDSDEEQPMELTEHIVRKVSPPNESLQSSNDSEMMKESDQSPPMEFTEVSTFEIAEPTEQMDLTEPQQKIQRSTSEEDDTVSGSQAMDLTQPYQNINSVRNQEDDSTQAMDLTQTAAKVHYPEQEDYNESAHMDLSRITEETSGVEEQIITTTIPLAETSHDIIEHESSPVSLSQFLADVGVQFYDDLKFQKITTLEQEKPIRITTDPPTLHDYITAKPYLTLLALYEFCNSELSRDVDADRKMYEEFAKHVETNNPAFLEKYYELDEKDRATANIKILFLRDYAKLKSKETWYTWRNRLVESLIEQLDKELSALNNDKSNLVKNKEKLDVLYERSTKYLQELSKKYDELKNGKVSPTEIENLKLFVSTGGQDMRKIAKELNEKEEELKRISEKVQENQSKRRTLQSELRTKPKPIDENNIESVYQHYKTMDNLSDVTFSEQDNKITFLLDNALHCDLDFNQDAIDCTLANNKLKNDKLIDIPSMFPINTNQNITVQFEEFSEYWSCLKKLDFGLFYSSLKYPTSIVVVDNAIRITIDYYNFDKDYKLSINGTLQISDLIASRQNINFEAKLIRGKLSDTFKEEINRDLKEFSFFDEMKIIN